MRLVHLVVNISHKVRLKVLRFSSGSRSWYRYVTV